MRWSAAEVLVATGGRLLGGAPSTTFAVVGIDSRTLPAEALFVPVRGRRDGHDFVAAALATGAAGYLVETGHPVAAAPTAAAVAIEVADTGAALLALGRAARRRLDGPVVGITGSVGKTSTKDLLAAAMVGRWRVTASERSFNNELGLPLTLVNAAADTEVTVVEMGARGVGHIRLLCEIAAPTVGVVTAVAPVHLETFGSLDAVASAKAELVEALPVSGTAVLNADDPRVAAMAGRTRAGVLRWSAGGQPAEVVAREVEVGPDLRAVFRLESPWGAAEVRLGVRGAHQVGNALAAAAAALACGTPLADVAAGLAAAVVSPWRMDLRTAPDGGLVLNDAYNANPASVASALRSLAALPARRRVAVLGEMAELGPRGPGEHAAAAALAAELGIEVVAVGTDAYGVPAVTGVDSAVAAVGELGEGVAVLVKGSRVTGLERLAARLAGDGDAPI